MHKLLRLSVGEGDTKKAHAGDELCNSSGRILHHLSAILSFTLQNNPEKQTSHGLMHPKAPPHITQPHIESLQQELTFINRSPSWQANTTLGHASAEHFYFWLQTGITDSLGIFILYSSKCCRNDNDLRLHGSRCRYAACVGGTLKTSPCFRYKSHHSVSCSEDEKTGI